MNNNEMTLEEFYLKHVVEKLGEEFKKRFLDADEDFDLEVAMDELMDDYRDYFNENVDPNREFYDFALKYLNAAGISEDDVAGIERFSQRNQALTESYMEALENVDKEDIEEINRLNDKIEKGRAIGIGILSISLNNEECKGILA